MNHVLLDKPLKLHVSTMNYVLLGKPLKLNVSISWCEIDAGYNTVSLPRQQR